MKLLKRTNELKVKLDDQSKQIAKLEGMLDGFNKGMEIMVETLQNRIEVLEFLQKNPSGIRLCQEDKRNYNSPTRYGFEYVKDNKVKRAFMAEFYNNVCVTADGNTITIRDDDFSVIQKVEFDVSRERFIYIKEIISKEG